jgi:adenylate cyclase
MSVPSEQRRLAAIMFTDMVGYTALAQKNEALALELLEEHRRILRSIFPRFNGTEIKTIGDAFLVEFQSALEAAQCAVEIQRTLAKRNHDVSREHRIELRIGIHVGDVVHREGDVYGDGVNIASRIQPVAGIGGICISVDVERQIHNALEVTFEKLAPIELKNVQVPMDLFRIVLPWERDTRVKPERRGYELQERRAIPFGWIGAAVLLLTVIVGSFLLVRYLVQSKQSGTAEVPAKSIAVLPFENLSEEKGNAYFAEGVQDEILTRLAKVADLKVISHTSTQRFKSAPEDLRQIAKQLGVMNILEGSVQKAADQVRVNVQLINALTDAHLWAETYDRKLTDIFAVESDVAKTIADTLQAKLTGSEQRALTTQPTANPEAYQLYLQGRFFWNKRTAADLQKSIEFFNQAIARDPKYALAYAALAQSWVVLPAYNGGAPNECFPQGEAAAKRALALDNNLSDAHVALAEVKGLYDFEFKESIAEYERTIQLNPNDATAHHWLAIDALAAMGQTEREVAEMKRALELDPLSLIINANLGFAYIHARRFDEAIAQLRKTVEMDGEFYYARFTLAEALELNGAIPEATAEYQKTISISDDPAPLGMLGRLYALHGRKDEAQQILQQLRQRRQQRYTIAYSLALVCIGLGDRNQALDWLELGYRERDGVNIGQIRIDPLLDPLHGDARFEALAEKIVPAREFGNAVTQK